MSRVGEVWRLATGPDDPEAYFYLVVAEGAGRWTLLALAEDGLEGEAFDVGPDFFEQNKTGRRFL